MHQEIEAIAAYRSIILEQFQMTLEELFVGEVSIFMYGSLATGLALDTSDMDLAVHGLPIKDRKDISKYMNMIYSRIEVLDFVQECRCIHTAQVPVIKLNIDLLPLA